MPTRHGDRGDQQQGDDDGEDVREARRPVGRRRRPVRGRLEAHRLDVTAPSHCSRQHARHGPASAGHGPGARPGTPTSARWPPWPPAARRPGSRPSDPPADAPSSSNVAAAGRADPAGRQRSQTAPPAAGEKRLVRADHPAPGTVTERRRVAGDRQRPQQVGVQDHRRRPGPVRRPLPSAFRAPTSSWYCWTAGSPTSGTSRSAASNIACPRCRTGSRWSAARRRRAARRPG